MEYTDRRVCMGNATIINGVIHALAGIHKKKLVIPKRQATCIKNGKEK